MRWSPSSPQITFATRSHPSRSHVAKAFARTCNLKCNCDSDHWHDWFTNTNRTTWIHVLTFLSDHKLEQLYMCSQPFLTVQTLHCQTVPCTDYRWFVGCLINCLELVFPNYFGPSIFCRRYICFLSSIYVKNWLVEGETFRVFENKSWSVTSVI